ncbi:50S ribosomal protein L13 [Buchnera aphidicola (Chaitoregma tattakana)]|uniref:50S ribosomal protein L13 n=1 Tax=Buchnera aphidicola TaxID=9 RepID=UPI0031B86E15
MKTFFVKNIINKKRWFYVNAENKILGRLASSVSKYLIGKHKSNYVSSVDNGDYIVIFNAEKISFTGNKINKKIYFRHTGYVGGLKAINLKSLLLIQPEFVIKRAIKGMLPKNTLGRKIIKKLKIYSGNVFKHSAQKPTLLEI